MPPKVDFTLGLPPLEKPFQIWLLHVSSKISLIYTEFWISHFRIKYCKFCFDVDRQNDMMLGLAKIERNFLDKESSLEGI